MSHAMTSATGPGPHDAAVERTGPTVRVGSGTVTILLGGDATGGTFALFDYVTDPGGSLPLHVHEREDEAFYIFDGRYEFQVGARTVVAGPGDFLVAPRGVPHGYRNLGDRPARKLSMVWPAGLDRFFLEIGQPVTGATASPAANEVLAIPGFAEVVAKYGIRMLPTPPASE
jgi:quercetin dioxygenase-like cupin family protein